jgi:mannan endo-1,4-beta-mannosidase
MTRFSTWCGPVAIAWAMVAVPCAAAVVRLEAEEAALEGPVAANARAGFSGSGYVTGMTKRSHRITFESDGGLHRVTIRHSSPHGPKGYVLDVNGVKHAGTFRATGDTFADHDAGVIEFAAGRNVAAVEYGWGWYDVDAIEITPAGDVAPPPRPSARPCDPAATPAAAGLLRRICEASGSSTLSGVQGAADLELARKTIGVEPAIVSEDLMDYSPSRVERGTKPRETDRLLQHAREGRTVSALWHWNAPRGLEPDIAATPGAKSRKPWFRGFYTDATTFDVAAALADEQGDDHRLLLRDIDAIAVQLRRLADADVPVLWRPLHEAEGGWFWWGAKGPEPFKALWRLVHRRLTGHHGLHNLVWVFTGSADPAWYPGDDVVDVVGLDAYPADPRDPLASDWAALAKAYGGRKPLALTEYGGVPDVGLMQRHGVWWSYFVSWSGSKGMRRTPPDEIRRIYALPGVGRATVPAP